MTEYTRRGVPEARRYGSGIPASAEGGITAALRKAASLQLEPHQLRVCDPAAESTGARLHNYLLTIEPVLAEAADTGGGNFEILIGLIDKSRQNPINQLGGVEKAGEMSMLAYWDVADRATNLMCNMEGFSLLKVDLIRVSPTSDEGIFLLCGNDVKAQLESGFGAEAEIRHVFRKAWEIARGELDLRKYAYTLEVPYGSVKGESFDLDLEAFSRVLRHPEMIVACHASLSDPVGVSGREPGFVNDAIRELENREVAFYDEMPQCFRGANGGSAEVVSPFIANMARIGMVGKSGGTYVEIKLAATEADSRSLLSFVNDTMEWKGTSKGYAEIFSGRFGMRSLNTFVGKARANSILTPIAQAMGEISQEHAVLPMNGGYLAYWVDMEPNALTEYRIKSAIRKQLREGRYAVGIGLEPDLVMVDARGMRAQDMRARFILNSMGKELYPPEMLGMADFVLNFIENISPAVQQEVFEALARSENGGSRIGAGDLDRMQMLRRICAMRRTIRDAEDIVWTLRNDAELPDDIAARRSEVETWLFDFSAERFASMFRLLALRIRSEMERRGE